MSPLPTGGSVDNLKATLSNNTSGVIMLRYGYRALGSTAALKLSNFRIRVTFGRIYSSR